MTKTLIATALFTAIGLAHAESATYVIEPTHTFVNFESMHMGTSTLRGRFEKKEGSVTIDRAAKTGAADITIDMNSVSTGVSALDGHMKSKDFFKADEFPTARFVGDKFSFDGDKVATVSGSLTMRGKTHPVVLTATHFGCYTHPMLKREVCGGDFETRIQRSLWDVTYGLDYGFPDAIRLLIQIEAIKR